MDNNQMNPYSLGENTGDESVRQNTGTAENVGTVQNTGTIEHPGEAQNPYGDTQYTYAGGWMGNSTPISMQNPYQQDAYQSNPYQQSSYQQNTYQQGFGQQDAYQSNPYQQSAYQPNPYEQAPYYTQQPVGNMYSQPVKQGNGMVGFAIAGLVCGIFSIIACCIPGVNIFIAIGGLVFGIISLTQKYDGRGMAIAGTICSGIGLVMSILFTIMLFME